MRCNAGINPEILCDQHLIAEQSELLIVDGMLRKYNFQMKAKIPPAMTLNKGHILFWTDKILYLHKRHNEIKNEIINRKFKVTDKEFKLDEYPEHLLNDWRPSNRDSDILKTRIVEKIHAKGDKLFWRYRGKYIDSVSMPNYINTLTTSPLYYV
jgi:deoxyribonuclease (pyrimidine dimer)